MYKKTNCFNRCNQFNSCMYKFNRSSMFSLYE